MPYIALQLIGIEAVLKTMGITGHWPIIVAFTILAAYTYRSGLRAPALIAFVKDTTRGCARAFLCLLAYYLEWHLRRAWAEPVFDDEHSPPRTDPVAKAERSPQAKRKASTQRTAAGTVCHFFRSLLLELALVARTTNRIVGTEASFTKIARANATQRRALELVGLDPTRL